MIKRILCVWILLSAPCFGALTQHWELDDNAASTTVVATVGTNVALAGGDNTSVVHSTDAPGNLITASFDLDGSADYLDTSTLISRALNNAYSLSLWVKFDSVTSQPIFGRVDNANHRMTLANSTTIEVRGTSTLTYTISAVSTGVWYNILLTFDASNNCRVFVNGTESPTGSQVGTGISSLVIGKSLSSFLDGHVAWVKRFDSDESANAGTIHAEGVSSGSPVPNMNGNLQLLNGNMQ